MRSYKQDFACSENLRGGPLFFREPQDEIPRAGGKVK